MNCDTCWYGITSFDYIVNSRAFIEKGEEVATFICENGMVRNSTMCSIVKMMGDILVPVVAESILSADYLCSYALQVCDRPRYEDLPSSDYVERLLKSKPANLQDNNYLNTLYHKINEAKKSDSNRKLLKAVHISDPHIDFLYKEGTNADCNLPICCRELNGFTDEPKHAAGAWGHYKCDIPH